MFRSPHADQPIPEVSVYDYLFADIAEEDLDRIAIIDGTSGAETTFRQLLGQIDLIAGALSAGGIGPGDVVGLHCPNSPVFAAVFHGILRSGATATTLNSLYTPEEIAGQLRDSKAKLLFTVSALLPAAGAGAADAGLDDDAVIVLDGAEGHHDLRELLAAGHHAPVVDIDPATHLAVLPYSSGTTGRPKGVMLTHRNLVANVQQTIPFIDVNRDDRVLAVLPFFHIYGMTVLLNFALKRRARLVTMPRFDLTEFLRNIQEHGCTFLFIAPPVAVALAKHPLVDEYDMSTVRTIFSGAAPLDRALGEAVGARLGAQMRQGYGMTETSPVSHAIPMDRDDLSLGSIGFPICNMECRLVDPETGADIEAGADGMSEAGELLLRGPNIMAGYLGNDEATRATLDDDGFLHTGDIARVDADGVFYIVDRLKELIKYKGWQVAPAELEAVLLTHPEIADAAVIGVPDEEGGEAPKAFVVRTAGSELSEDAVMAHVAEHVAPYKKVRHVEFIDVVPKSTAGKILRKELRAR